MSSRSRRLVFSAICIALNVTASFLAIGLRLPVYLDTTGTILVARFLGTPWALVVALLSSLLNASYDVFALAFAPQGLVVALVASWLLRHPRLSHWPRLCQGLIIGFCAALIGAAIAAFAFAGVTSAGSTYLVQFFHYGLGFSLYVTTFIIQLLTDVMDKTALLFLLSFIERRLPKSIVKSLNV